MPTLPTMQHDRQQLCWILSDFTQLPLESLCTVFDQPFFFFYKLLYPVVLCDTDLVLL